MKTVMICTPFHCDHNAGKCQKYICNSTTLSQKVKEHKYLFFSILRLRLYSFLPLNDLIIKHAVTFFITFANEKDASHLRAKAILKKNIYNKITKTLIYEKTKK